MLYNQLLYYSHLFDYEELKKLNQTLNFGNLLFFFLLFFINEMFFFLIFTNEVNVIKDETGKKNFELLRTTVDGYLAKCAARYVDLGALFKSLS